MKIGVFLREPNSLGASIDIVDTLAGMHGAEEGVHLTPEQTHAKDWTKMDVTVEGVPRRFWMIGDQEHWLAYREERETWLFVHSRGIPAASIDLVQVDPRDYLSNG